MLVIKRERIKRFFGWALAAALMAMNYTPSAVAFKRLPDKIYVEPGQSARLPEFGGILEVSSNAGLGLSDAVSGDHSVSNEGYEVDSSLGGESYEGGSSLGGESHEVDFTDNVDNTNNVDNTSNGDNAQNVDNISNANNGGSYEVSYDLLGVLPVKTVSVAARNRSVVMPGGCSVGVTMYTKGALVVGITDIVTNTGEAYNPCKIAGLTPGDVVEKAAGETISSADHLIELVERTNGAPMALEIIRKGQRLTVSIMPVMDRMDGRFRLGLWARDSTAGVGTMTFYDPSSGMYGALGHAITDLDTKERLALKKGELVRSSIVDVRHGSKGTPGELKGSFEDAKLKMGSIDKNTEFGIFGKLYAPYSNPIYPDGLPVASQDEVKIGAAEILTTINAGTKAFSCEIERISPQSRPSPKGMIIRITDPALLGATGGIVQGMSGSPIIQDGKIIGAVTHVFVNDPTRGYGMYIEWMLENSQTGR